MLSLTLAMVPRTGVSLDGAVDDDAIAPESGVLPDMPADEDVPPLEQPMIAPAATSSTVAATGD